MDTGLAINYHALAPLKYKRNMIITLVHRIFNSTSTYEHLHTGLMEAKKMLDYNQYPSNWYEKIIHKTLEKIIIGESKVEPEPEENKKMVFVEYRGKITDQYVKNLISTGAPIKPIITLRKIKTALPSLKVGVENVIASNIIYKYTCSHCQKASYTGMTCRHFKTRVAEHLGNGERKTAVMMHKEVCKESKPSIDDFKILRKVQRHDLFYLSVMEALYIREENPILNTKDEFKGRMLRIKI